MLTIIVFIGWKFHGSNFSAGGGFFIHGAAVKSILIAIPNGGIVFSLLGFEQAVQLGGEARNPSDVPKAVIVSLIIGATIYILLQVAFIGALQPSLLAQAHTWADLGPTSNNATIQALNAAPFHQVAVLAGLGWLGVLLRIDAIVSPARHRTDLSDVRLADPVRAVEERLHPTDVRERLRPRPGAGDRDPPDRRSSG